jgi:hypothetical protein
MINRRGSDTEWRGARVPNCCHTYYNGGIELLARPARTDHHHETDIGGCASITMNRTRQVVAASFLFGILFLPTNTDAATAFQIHSDPTCTNGLSLTNVKMVCTDEESGGSSTCVFGDSAHVSGTLSIPDSGLFGNSMTSKACLYGAYPCRELQTNGDFCETFGLSEYGCPTTGEYSIEKTFDLPGDQGLSLGKLAGTR